MAVSLKKHFILKKHEIKVNDPSPSPPFLHQEGCRMFLSMHSKENVKTGLLPWSLVFVQQLCAVYVEFTISNLFLFFKIIHLDNLTTVLWHNYIVIVSYYVIVWPSFGKKFKKKEKMQQKRQQIWINEDINFVLGFKILLQSFVAISFGAHKL